nr:ABC transporter ATP-binding protein [Candidatus Njordarchaeota archaeon]
MRTLVTSNQTAIKARRISKRYGGVVALNDLNLEVPYGCIHGLVGPNGAGKSTALRILCGIAQPSGGAASISGFDIENEPERAKATLGYLPEDPSGYDALTVQEFLLFIAKLYNIPRNTAEERVKRYVHQFKLEEHLEKYIGELSRGSMHRVVLCSLFIHEPKVFLLDDPFNSLDPYSSWLLRRILIDKRRQRRAVLLATHMLDIAERICDSFTVLNRGITIAQGTLAQFRVRFGPSSLEEIFLKLTSET